MKNFQFLKINFLLLISFAMFACNQKNNSTEENNLEESDLVKINKDLATKFQIETQLYKPEYFHPFIQVKGYLKIPPQNKATLTTPVGAIIENIAVIEGQQVRKGQILARLAHPDLLKLQSEFISLYNDLIYWENEYNRQKNLFEQKAIPEKEFIKTRSQYYSVKAGCLASAQKIELLGLSPDEIVQNGPVDKVSLKSPFDGYVESININLLQYADPMTPLMVIINPEHLHADLIVYEEDLSFVKTGQNVKFSTLQFPGKDFDAQIITINKSVENNSRAIHLHADIHDEKNILIAGMYIEGKIFTGDSLIYLPETAAVEYEGQLHLFEKNGENDQSITFEVINITSYQKVNEKFVIDNSTAENLKNKNLVTNGVYYLWSEWKKHEFGEDE